jgi:CO/xanthine dehydrogenase Mo-binding subunit
MLHGRIVRPRGQGALGPSPKVISIDESSIADLPNARIIRKLNFIGVVAPLEWDAVRAAQALKVVWDVPATLPGSDGLADHFRRVAAAGKTNDDLVIDGDVSDLEKYSHVFKASYFGPYLSHGTMVPNCAVASVTSEGAVVMSSSQSVYGTRSQVARVLGIPEKNVRVQYYPGSCTFGMSCYDDCAAAAAILSQGAGKPVRLQFMRWDEFGWDNYCPPHLADVRAAVDANGKLMAFDYTGWSHGYVNRSTTTAQMVTGEPLSPGKQTPSGTNRLRLTMNEMYNIPVRRILDHDVYGPGLLKGGFLRSPLDPHYFFAAEQTLDHLAYMAKLDPVEFRRRNISDRRWLGVIEAAAKAANWKPRVAASGVSSVNIATGRGFAIGTHHVPIGNQEDRMTYAAAVVEVQVNKQNGVVTSTHVYPVMDCGLAVNPMLVENQLVSQAIHGTSIALMEGVKFNAERVTSLDWSTYQILRFGEAPAVTPTVVQQLLEQSSGAGEESLPAVVAATANAIFDATGVRIYEFPMTPDKVLGALRRANKA